MGRQYMGSIGELVQEGHNGEIFANENDLAEQILVLREPHEAHNRNWRNAGRR